MNALKKAVNALVVEIDAQGGAYYMTVPDMEEVVRAVLMAVRSEGPETWDAGVPVHFTAMIDAILNEEPKP